MNIYSYFYGVGQEEKIIPSKNKELYHKIISWIRLSNLSKAQSEEIKRLACERLIDDTKDHLEFQEEIKADIEARKKHFWSREFSDFPLYLLIFITCLTILYDRILNGMSNMDVLITFGFLIQIFGVYLSIKLLMILLIYITDRSKPIFWIGLTCLFLIYMLSNYASKIFTDVLFVLPLWGWMILQLVLLMISYIYVKKEKLL